MAFQIKPRFLKWVPVSTFILFEFSKISFNKKSLQITLITV